MRLGWMRLNRYCLLCSRYSYLPVQNPLEADLQQHTANPKRGVFLYQIRECAQRSRFERMRWLFQRGKLQQSWEFHFLVFKVQVTAGLEKKRKPRGFNQMKSHKSIKFKRFLMKRYVRNPWGWMRVWAALLNGGSGAIFLAMNGQGWFVWLPSETFCRKRPSLCAKYPADPVAAVLPGRHGSQSDLTWLVLLFGVIRLNRFLCLF